jgi:hypothetical protein
MARLLAKSEQLEISEAERPVTSLGYASTKLDIGFLTTSVKLPLSFSTGEFTTYVMLHGIK